VTQNRAASRLQALLLTFQVSLPLAGRRMVTCATALSRSGVEPASNRAHRRATDER